MLQVAGRGLIASVARGHRPDNLVKRRPVGLGPPRGWRARP